MKILIGTPTHQCKDYCMEEWLENVSKLQSKYPADLLLVDNSPGLDYIERVREYCEKYGVKNYKIKHLEIAQERDCHEKVIRSKEIIRQEILSKNYDAWFSWECDQIIPVNALNVLIGLMKSGDFWVVAHNCWAENDIDFNFDFGVALVKRNILEKYDFLPKLEVRSDRPDEIWYNAEYCYKNRLKEDGCKYAEVYGLIDPIYHLHNNK